MSKAAVFFGKRATLTFAALLTLGLGLAYLPALRAPFMFDDVPSLVDNTTLVSLGDSLHPPSGGVTVSGRPLLNFSFALNHLLGSTPSSYRAGNILIHFAAALLLFGIVRRTLASQPTASLIAGTSALLWALHPLQTESVTYLVQRAESLAALFILASLYTNIRARQATPSSRWQWDIAGIAAAFAGVATKETAVIIPLVVLLHDRTFTDGSFANAVRNRWGYYLGLLSSWVLLGWLIADSQGRGDTVLFSGLITPGGYFALQLPAVAHYARLAFWPHPLVFDYGPYQGLAVVSLWPVSAITLCALLGTAVCLWRFPRSGFLAAVFFIALAPSSSFVPIITQVAAEHRVYLALAPLLVGVICAGQRWLPRQAIAAIAIVALLGALTLTMQRNLVYRSAEGLWRDTVAAYPINPRAHLNLGREYARAGQTNEAIQCFEAALRLQPNYVTALYNLGTSLITAHQPQAAVAPLRRVLELEAEHAEAAYNLGNALAQLGDHTGAISAYQHSLRTQPDRLAARYNLANSLLALDRLTEAIAELRRAATLAPDQADVRFNLANALLQNNQPAAAIPEYEAVLRLTPGDAEAAANLRLARAALRGTRE